MEDECLVLGDLDQLGEVLLGLLRIDVGRRVVTEDAEVAVDAQIDRRWLDRLLVERVDDDATAGEFFAYRPVGEDHGLSLSTDSDAFVSAPRLIRCRPAAAKPYSATMTFP